MKKYKVISFDMFQTLVDVNKRVPEIWKGILEDEYTKEKGEVGAKSIINNLRDAYDKSLNPFCNMEGMFRECARKVILETGYKVTPEKIAYHLMYQHGHAPFYEEALYVLGELAKDYTVIISSDSSHLMVNNLLAECNVEKAFISDDLCYYKGDADGKFFASVLAELKVKPDEVLHIGDSFSDIVGAKTAKIDSCWINRSKKKWNHTEKPDYIIHNLNEVFEILS